MEWRVAPSYKGSKILKVDEEAHKALIAIECPRCSGKGIIISHVENGVPIPIPVDGGTCYKCNGIGSLKKLVKAYTPSEYDKYVATQERAKARKAEKEKAKLAELEAKSAENKAIWLTDMGFDPVDPTVYLIHGNTYEIKDWIKGRGGRYNPALNWYFTNNTNELPDGYDYVEVPFDELYNWFPRTKRMDLKDNAKEIAAAARRSLDPESNSDYIGEIKERLRDLKVTLTGTRAISSMYGDSTLLTFDYNGNVLIWFTSSCLKEDKTIVGNEYILTGTVKKHESYNGIKQTYLNRCIIK